MVEKPNTAENLNYVEKPKALKSFSELADYFERKYPDLIKIKPAEETKLLIETARRDEAVDDKGLKGVLEEMGISTENLRSFGNNRWSIPYKEKLHENLPSGYAFKGGAARYYLREALNLPTDWPRDYDVVRLTENEPYTGADNEVARRFMPKDFEFGDGVEPALNLGDYFETRDLTINEVLATDKEIIATDSAILDTARNILRLTDYERYNYNSSGLAGPKMVAKMLRLYSDNIQQYGDVSSLQNIGHASIDKVFISPFWLAVNLDRAWERGTKQAADYVRVLSSAGQLPEGISEPEDAARYLLDCMGDESFVFRSAPIEDFDMEDDWVEQLHNRQSATISKIKKKVVKR